MPLMLSVIANAQIDGYQVKGQVIDRQTREAVPYAAIFIVGVEDSGVMADSTGRFTIEKVKPGIRQFTAIQMGYRMEELKLWSGTIVPALGITVEF